MDKEGRGENLNCEKTQKLDAVGKIVITAFMIGLLVLSYLKPVEYLYAWEKLFDPALLVGLFGVCLIFKRALPTFVKGRINEYGLTFIAILAGVTLGVLSTFDVVKTEINFIFLSGCASLLVTLTGFVADGFLALSRKNSGEGVPNVGAVSFAKKLSKILAFVAIGVCVAIFLYRYFTAFDLVKAVSDAICALVVFAPFNLWMSAIAVVNFAKGKCVVNGIAFDGKDLFEKFSEVKTFAFDEYALIENLRVEKVVVVKGEEESVLKVAQILSEGELTDAIKAYKEVEALSCSDLSREEGCASGIIDGKLCKLVSSGYVAQNFAFDLSTISRTDCITLFVLVDKEIVGALLVGYDVKGEGVKTVCALRRAGVDIALLSSNTKSCWLKIKNECGIEGGSCDLFGREKEYRVAELKFKGDGDIAYVSNKCGRFGADIVINTGKEGDNSDVRIFDGNIEKIPLLLRLSRKVFSKIKFNIILSFFHDQ